MKIYYKILMMLIIFLVLIPSVGYVDEVNEIPRKYLMPVDSESLLDPTNKLRKGQAWQVFSDRNNNKTYTKPDGINHHKTLSFLEVFYVAEEQDDYVRIVKDSELNFLTMSPSVKNYGWIKKTRLLIWSHCLVTEKGKINTKAMVLNTIEHLKQPDDDEPSIVRFRKGPDIYYDNTGNESKLFQFFFVYKRDNYWVLLGRDAMVYDQNHPKDTIVGWAPIKRLTMWDHRIAVEPNWEKDAVKERRNGLKAKFFVDDGIARKYKKGKHVKPIHILWDRDPLGERYIGEWRRFPLLKKINNEIFQAGVMGDISTSDSNLLLKSEKNADIQNKMDTLLTTKRKINIVFVVDATNSMAPYFRPISNAIEESMKQLKSKNKYSFGAVIYRDLTESKKRQRKIQSLSDSKTISNFLSGIKAGDENNNTKHEAVFYGLKGALNGIGLDKKNTNVIVLVGDTGDHNSNNAIKIVDLLVKKECAFIAFQVKYKKHQAYNDFILQTKSIINDTAKRIFEKNSYLGVDKPHMFTNLNRHWLSQGTYSGCLLDAISTQLKPEQLKSELENFIKELDSRNEELIKAMRKIIEDGSSFDEASDSSKNYKFTSSFTDGLLNFFREAQITEEEFDKIKRKKYQLYLRLSGTMKVDSQIHPLFKRVLLFERSELDDLRSSIKNLYKAGTLSISEERKHMYKTWKEILKIHIGDLSDHEMDKLGLNEIHEKVTGLPSSTDAIKNVKLKDIIDKRVFPDNKFIKYVDNVKSKIKNIERILNEDNYKFKFRSNEIPYYWISEDLIP